MAVIRYYVADQTAEKGFAELTESEWLALMGTEETRNFANQVYKGEMDISEVPEGIREKVSAVVAAKVECFGLYSERELPANEALNIITGDDPICPN